ncbi:unnamed protein product [Prorocentrum cordatum]|uniref:Uncharacterized protein n=1 Tax=Prorocentrum cordatum TaxID=2364126 RepID=A0ABN9SB37_9DINO|nr:unnamed protein product [Polarella glacialis]
MSGGVAVPQTSDQSTSRSQSSLSSTWSCSPGHRSLRGDVPTGMAAGSAVADDDAAGLIQARAQASAPGGGGPDELAAGQEGKVPEDAGGCTCQVAGGPGREAKLNSNLSISDRSGSNRDREASLFYLPGALAQGP